MSFEDLLSDLARTLAPVPDSTAAEAREAYLRACRLHDENPAEQQRIDDLADLLEAEETLYTQARAAADRGDAAAAIPLLRTCAEAGTGEAAWLLAQLLEETGSTAEAMIWYQRASDDGDERAGEKLAAIRARPCPHASCAGSLEENTAGNCSPVPLAPPASLRAVPGHAYSVAWDDGAAGPAAPAASSDLLYEEMLSLLELRAPGRGHTPGEILLPASIVPLLFSSLAPDRRAPLSYLRRAAEEEVCSYLTPSADWHRTRLILELASRSQEPETIPGADWTMPGFVLWSPTGSGKSQLLRWLVMECKRYSRPCPANLSRYLAAAGRRDTRWAAREPTVAEVMLPPSEVPACRPDTTVAQALELLVQSGTQALPVCETAQVAGIVTLADLARHISDHQGALPSAGTVRALMRPAVVVPPGTPLPAIARAIADDGIIVVSSSADQPDGYLTAESLLTQAPPGTSTRPGGPARAPLLIPGTGAVLLNRL